MKSLALTKWLIMQPASAQVGWHSWNVSAQEPWAGGWVDIKIPAFKEDTCLTFVPPHQETHHTGANLYALERDLDVYAVYAPSKRWFVQEIPVPRGVPITPEQDQLLNTALGAHPDSTRGVRTAWTAERLAKGLHEWAGRYAGRGDLRWEWDSQAGLPPAIQALLDAVQAQIEPTYKIMPGVAATDQAFSVLATIPRWSHNRSQARALPRIGTNKNFDPFTL